MEAYAVMTVTESCAYRNMPIAAKSWVIICKISNALEKHAESACMLGEERLLGAMDACTPNELRKSRT